MAVPFPPPLQGDTEQTDKKDRRIQSWVFHVIGAGSVAFQFFVKEAIGLGKPDPTIIVLSGLIGGSPLMYQIWETYIKRKP